MSSFSFGSPAPATTVSSTGFSFGGSTTPAPAATTSGFSFGGSNTPAPAAGTSTGFSFGGSTASTPAAAPTSSGFGFGGSATLMSTTAPAAPASGGFSFGTQATSAPMSSSLFGASATSPATKSTGLFGGFGGTSSGNVFQTSSSSSLQQPQQQYHISMNTPFSALPPNTQKIISDTFMLLHQHKQTMNNVASMSPSSLCVVADGAGASSATNQVKSEIQLREHDLGEKISSVQQEFTNLVHKVDKVQEDAKELYSIAHECGIYPVQTIAARKRITLPGSSTVNGSLANKDASNSPNTPKSNISSDVVQKLNTLLQENALSVDRIERLPSNYLWNLIDDMDSRLQILGKTLVRLENDIRNREKSISEKENEMGQSPAEGLSLKIQSQVDMLIRVASIIGRVERELNELKNVYKEKVMRERLMRYPNISTHSPRSLSRQSLYDTTFMVDSSTFLLDPFLDADRKETQERQRIQTEVTKRRIIAAGNLPAMNPSSENATTATTSTATPSSGLFSTPSSGGGLFGSKPAATGLFGGSSTPAASVAPSSGFSFGSPAPATTVSSTGFSFGGSTTPAPAATTSGFSFGGSNTPAPAAGTSTGFSFGGSTASTPAAAPTSSGFGFGGSAAAPTSSGFSFGGVPAPSTAPSTGGFSFGGAAPQPSTSGLFGTTPASTDAPSRSNVRQRRAGRKR